MYRPETLVDDVKPLVTEVSFVQNQVFQKLTALFAITFCPDSIARKKTKHFLAFSPCTCLKLSIETFIEYVKPVITEQYE